MNIKILSNQGLEAFIKGVNIEQEEKDRLIKELPSMKEEQRIELYKALQDIYFLDVEEEELIKKIDDKK